MYIRKCFLAYLCGLIFFPSLTFAASGQNIADTTVEVHTYQGKQWFMARRVKTDDDSFVKIKDVLPGKYQFRIDDSDKRPDQFLAAEVRLKDASGKPLRDKTDVGVFAYINDQRVFGGTSRTDDRGWISLNGIVPGLTYELVVKGDGTLKKDSVLARIKTKAKIAGSEWFDSSYDRLTADVTKKTNGILEVKNVLPGKYKFKVKSTDAYDPTKPFALNAQLLTDKGKKIKKPTKVIIYASPNKIKTQVAEITTDVDGWVTIPAVQPGATYRLKVKD